MIIRWRVVCRTRHRLVPSQRTDTGRGTQSERLHSTVASSAAAQPAPEESASLVMPVRHYPSLQPPSYKPPELRKTQLHRQYTSLLRTSPLVLVFQHNNLRAPEFAGIRRELAAAIQRVGATDPDADEQAASIRLQVIQSGVFSAALRVVEYFDRSILASNTSTTPSSLISHDLSLAAHRASIPNNANNKGVKAFKRPTKLDSMLSGPIAVLSFPSVSPKYLAAALSVLAPTPGPSSAFPAPKRKTSPGYYEVPVQAGLQKLLLLGARIDGRALDADGTKWVGGIPDGIDGLRAQLVHTLQGAGMGLVKALDGASHSLWATLESRRIDMDSPDAAKSADES